MKILLVFLAALLVTVCSQPDVKLAFAQYSGELYNEVRKTTSGSFVVCPPSIENGLGLIYSGAKGDSAKQIASSLHLPETPNEFQEVIHQLTKNLRNPKENDYILNNANKVYINDDFKINEQYKDTLQKVYDADIENVDFSKKDVTAGKINRWIEGKTHNKIQNMVKEEQLGGVRAALVNAMYFQGKWVHEFNNDLTHKEAFHVDSSTENLVETMHLSGHFNYYESSNLRAQFLELAYKGDNITMTFVLPLNRFGLSTLESKITEVLLEPKFKEERVIMSIPKFKIDTNINLIPVLSKMGITEIFSNNADLSGMTETKEALKIGTAIQKAIIEVDEKGTVASAAFVGFVEPLSAAYVPPPTYYFKADQPFIYYIKVNGNVIFIGRYASS